jgi:hypothetical protein
MILNTKERTNVTIKRTAKYVAAPEMAYSLGIKLKHKTADQLYEKLELEGYAWSSPLKKWYLRPVAKPQNEMDKTVVRVRVTAHQDVISEIVGRVTIGLEQEGFKIGETSKVYPNTREPVDGGARVYLTVGDQLIDLGEDDE